MTFDFLLLLLRSLLFREIRTPRADFSQFWLSFTKCIICYYSHSLICYAYVPGLIFIFLTGAT